MIDAELDRSRALHTSLDHVGALRVLDALPDEAQGIAEVIVLRASALAGLERAGEAFALLRTLQKVEVEAEVGVESWP